MSAEDQHARVERLMRNLPLRDPSENLDQRVNATFAEFESPPGHFRFYTFALAASVLIAIAIGIRFALLRTHPPILTVASHPIQIERDISAVYDEGMVAGADEAVYRKIRRHTVREIWYIDPATHARLHVTSPIEQVSIQKVEAF